MGLVLCGSVCINCSALETQLGVRASSAIGAAGRTTGSWPATFDVRGASRARGVQFRAGNSSGTSDASVYAAGSAGRRPERSHAVVACSWMASSALCTFGRCTSLKVGYCACKQYLLAVVRAILC